MQEQERLEEILRLLNEQKMVKTSFLMERFGVSSETVRRDFLQLEKKGLLKKIYGGAVLKNLRSKEIQFANREEKNIREKQAIGKLAASLIQDEETVVLNSGTTVLEVAKHLHTKRNLTIITNCVYIALQLLAVEGFRVFLVGGELRSTEMATSGDLGNKFLTRFRADKAIIGIGGIDVKSGVTDYHIEESSIWREMVNIAEKTIIVADYSKFGASALNVVCETPEIDSIVTDWHVPAQELNEFRRRGVRVLTAEEGGQ